MSDGLKEIDDDAKANAGKSASISFFIVWVYVWFFQYDMPFVSIWTPLFVLGGTFIASFTLGPIKYIVADVLSKAFIKQNSDGGIVFRSGIVPISFLFKVSFFAIEVSASYFALHFFIGIAGL